MENLLQIYPHLQVGEIGLDWAKTEFSRETQTEIFLTQLALAESTETIDIEYQRTASVHCVRAHGDLLKIFKKRYGQPDPKPTHKSSSPPHPKHVPNIIMHCFSGSKDIAVSLSKLPNANVYFSFCQIKTDVVFCQVRGLLKQLLLCLKIDC